MSDKTVLDYTDEELAALSNDELLKLKEEAIFGAENSHIGQLSKKYLINSLYGANANKFFPLYNPEIAASITANGRYFIRKTADYVEAALQRVLPSSKPYTVYGDTDSFDSSTIININVNGEEKRITIGELFENGYDDLEYKPGKHLRKVDNIDALSMNIKDPLSPKIEYKKIVYVMKHKVNKKMYRLKINGKELKMTCDHCLIIKRNGKYIGVKPFEIQKGDKIIMVKENG